MSDVKNKLQASTAILIDSRAKDRYLGKVEPLYKKAGHIPGAKNYFWKDVLHADGSWKTVDELKEHFAAIPKEAEIIVSCGSGSSACPNIIGLQLRSEEHTSELQSRGHLVCRLLLEKKNCTKQL